MHSYGCLVIITLTNALKEHEMKIEQTICKSDKTLTIENVERGTMLKMKECSGFYVKCHKIMSCSTDDITLMNLTESRVTNFYKDKSCVIFSSAVLHTGEED